MIERPSPRDWQMYDAYLDAGRSARKAAYNLGVNSSFLIRGMMRCSRWKKASGWSEAYRQGIEIGMPQVDARERADAVAAFNTNMRRSGS